MEEGPSSGMQNPLKRSRSPSASYDASSSPPKRARPSLQSLPLPLLLITLATALHASAMSIYPSLLSSPSPSVPPSSSSSPSQPDNWAVYRQSLAGAVALLRRAITLDSDGAKWALRARAMLVEVLALAEGSRAEIDKVIAKGSAAAQSHEALTTYKHVLTSIHATLSSATNPKFARTTLRRILPSTTGTHPEWTYHHLLSLSALSLSSTSYDFPSALSALREVEKLATDRGDHSMRLAAKVLIARISMAEGRIDIAGQEVSEVANAWWGAEAEKELSQSANGGGKKSKSKEKELSSTPVPVEKDPSAKEGPTIPLGRALKIQFLLTYCLYHAQMGEVKKAKERLKLAHQLLDERTPEEGETEGWCKISINPANFRTPGTTSSPAPPFSNGTPSSSTTTCLLPSPDYVILQISPRSQIYSFAFLVSVAVHRDPFGSKPRSMLFSDEGLRVLDLKLTGKEALPSTLSPSHLLSTYHNLAATKLHLHLFACELFIMRSSPSDTLAHLTSAITTARQHDLWAEWSSRITLDWGLMKVSQGGEGARKEAAECFETVRQIEDQKALVAVASAVGGQAPSSSGVGLSSPMGRTPSNQKPPKSALWILSTFSLLLLSLSSTPTPSVRLVHTSPPNPLNELALSILSSIPPSPPPDLALVEEITNALTRGEIIKAKERLGKALGLANLAARNHAKCLLLALLANLFLFTRNDQAQKMLHASFHIARGMGGRVDRRTKEEKAAQPGVLGDDVVGNARLGLWVGEKLKEGFSKENDAAQARKQEGFNIAHRRVLDEERLS